MKPPLFVEELKVKYTNDPSVLNVAALSAGGGGSTILDWVGEKVGKLMGAAVTGAFVGVDDGCADGAPGMAVGE